MDNDLNIENKNLEFEEKQEDDKQILQSKNVFIYDNPVGRLYFLLTILGLFAVVYIYFFMFNLYLEHYATNSLLPLTLALYILIFIFSAWVNIVNYAKRIYDLIGDKKRGLFYSISLYLISLISLYIPFLKFVAAVLVLGILIVLLVVPGKLVK